MSPSRGCACGWTRTRLRCQTLVRAVGFALWLACCGLVRKRTRPAAQTTMQNTAQTVQRILVAHYLLLGDTVLLAGLLKKIRQQYPLAECVVLCRPAYATLFAHQPYGARALPFHPKEPAGYQALWAEGGFDLAYIPDDNRYAWLARAARARWIVGFAKDRPAWKNWLLDEAVAFAPEPESWSDMTLRLVQGKAPAPYQHGEWPAPAARGFAQPIQPYVVLHVGASSPLRYWPAHYWRELAEQLAQAGYQPVFSAGPGEQPLVAAVDPVQRYQSYAEQLDLAQLWQLFAQAHAVVVPDTGAAHVARLSGATTIMLFGPGSSILHGDGYFWQHCDSIILAKANYPCRNQQVYFRREVAWLQRCKRPFDPYGDRSAQQGCPRADCMAALSPAQVMAQIMKKRLTQRLSISASTKRQTTLEKPLS